MTMPLDAVEDTFVSNQPELSFEMLALQFSELKASQAQTAKTAREGAEQAAKKAAEKQKKAAKINMWTQIVSSVVSIASSVALGSKAMADGTKELISGVVGGLSTAFQAIMSFFSNKLSNAGREAAANASDGLEQHSTSISNSRNASASSTTAAGLIETLNEARADSERATILG
ncbi:MAG: hypothetical protein R3A47_02525 [Polyangiales bacterium]